MNQGKYRISALFLALALLLSACGKEEYVVEEGIGGYVYVSEKIPGTNGVSNLKIAGDYLYYTQNGGNNVVRISLANAFPEEGNAVFSRGKTILDVSSGKVEVPEDAEEALREKAGTLYGTTNSEEAAEPEKIKFMFSLGSFTADNDQRLYYVLQVYVNTGSALEFAGNLLCSQSGDGQQEYKVFWPDIEDLAVDGHGNVYVLTAGGICAADSEGRQAGTVSPEGYQAGGNVFRQELFADLDGHVYYSSCSNLERKSCEIVKDKGGNLQLKEAGELPGNGYDSYCAMPGGNILFYGANSEQILYEYDRESGTTGELLCWTDSGLQSSLIDSVAGISPDKLLVACFSTSGGLYQLTRTPVEELPEKEVLVLASANPDMELQDAVMKFNQNSNKYRIVIDGYGAYYSDAESRWVIPELDPALVSSDPPDLVDLKQLNISKYAEKDIFEDLNPYLDGSSVLSREEFPENMLEGLTVHGKLVCLSSRFSVQTLTGASRRLKALESWTMEDMYALSETCADSEILINNEFGEECAGDFYLGSLCARYYLEKFVDWDKETCSFDSREFGRMLEWVGEHASGPADRMESSMMSQEEKLEREKNSLLLSLDVLGLDVYTLQRQEVKCGEEYSLLGFPGTEGRGYFRADLQDAIGITADSKNKDGAWEFLEYYLTKEPGSGYYAHGFAANKTLLQKDFEDAMREYSIRYTDEDGVEHEGTDRESKGTVSVGGEYVDFYAIPQRQADALLEAIEQADFTPVSETEEMIVRIVTEEAESYFRGDRSLEAVISVIQNRAELVLKEMGGA